MSAAAFVSQKLSLEEGKCCCVSPAGQMSVWALWGSMPVPGWHSRAGAQSLRFVLETPSPALAVPAAPLCTQLRCSL